MPSNDESGESNERTLNTEALFADDMFAAAEDAETANGEGKEKIGKRAWEPPSVAELQAMLPQYEILGIIGRGGMGAVYKARQAKLKRDVAIKLLPELLTQGEDDVFKYAARFELEAQAMASLDHPAIVSVHDFGETERGQLYFVMEFIDGMDIHQYLREHGGILPQEHALSIAVHVLSALEYAHQNGVVHRDIKPANILLNREGRVKIADFGLAKTFTESTASSAPALTMPNIAFGSPDFVAPEVFDQNRKLDHRADLYAVGVMLYQMLTGTLPRGQFKLPSELNSQLDPRLDQIIDQSLQADPLDRYSSAGELHQALHPIITSPMTRLEMGADVEDIVVKAKSKSGLYAGLAIATVFLIGIF
ncbi:MAG: serine/threonine protein kinase, partial [Methylococcales bacterium]|nr:serine/threonine protein kinase [Methylococcales bacterium]